MALGQSAWTFELALLRWVVHQVCTEEMAGYWPGSVLHVYVPRGKIDPFRLTLNVQVRKLSRLLDYTFLPLRMPVIPACRECVFRLLSVLLFLL